MSSISSSFSLRSKTKCILKQKSIEEAKEEINRRKALTCMKYRTMSAS